MAISRLDPAPWCGPRVKALARCRQPRRAAGIGLPASHDDVANRAGRVRARGHRRPVRSQAIRVAPPPPTYRVIWQAGPTGRSCRRARPHALHVWVRLQFRAGHEYLPTELLSLPSSVAEITLSPQRKREKLFEAILGQLEAEAQHRSVLMVFEDAHWIDPTSRELLDLTVDRVRRLPVLLVITFRPEFQPPWSGRSHVTSLALNRLGERDGEMLVQTLAGNIALTAEMVAEIVERTDGVPLFVEELTKAVLESAAQGDRVAAVLATASQTALSVPATLHASLMARLDRLGPAAKEIAQIGAVLGREFAYELIEPVAQRPERELQAALDQLGEAGLLFCRGVPPHSSYLFKHALVQDAAYSTLLRGRRQELHARVAAALEAHFADLAERQPELLAHHLTSAGDTERAVEQWLKAGRIPQRDWLISKRSPISSEVSAC
jgi:predicted ATPase